MKHYARSQHLKQGGGVQGVANQAIKTRSLQPLALVAVQGGGKPTADLHQRRDPEDYTARQDCGAGTEPNGRESMVLNP